MGGEDALGLGIEVVGAVTQVVGEAEDSALVGDEDMASRSVNGDRLAAQVSQGGGVVHLADGEGFG